MNIDKTTNLNLQYCEKCQIHYFPDFDNNLLPTSCAKCNSSLIDAGFDYDKYKQLPKTKKCNNCKRKYPKRFIKCPRCYEQLVKLSTTNKNANNTSKTEVNIPKCPTCGSTNIQRITVGEKIVSGAVWGLFSNKIHKSFMCNNCKYMW